MLRAGVLFLIVLVAAPVEALAGDICDYYRRSSPEIYRLLCTSGKRHAHNAGAQSTFADGFNLNSGSLPTEPSSYGFETIGSYIRDDLGQWQPTFALVKGYHKIGTGVSTSGNNTFYGNDLVRRELGPPALRSFKPIEQPVGKLTNVNAGAAVDLWSNPHGASAKLGLSLRYNNTTATLGGGPGLIVDASSFVFGVGLTRERVSNFLPPVCFGSVLLGYRVWLVELEYDMLTNSAGLGLAPIHVLTGTVHLGRFMASAALRYLNYLPDGYVTQYHLALQALVSSSFSVGALYNYVPGANSLAVQYYF